MTLRIAFTGPGNTGKSTVIGKLAEDFGASVYPETAREVLKTMKDFNMSEFQEQISVLEEERVALIREDIAEVILVDRTSVDGLVYSIFNLHLGVGLNLNQKEIAYYDIVVLFTEGFKDTMTEQFSHYNDERLVELFRTIMKYIYGDKLVEFRNGAEYEKIKELILSHIS